MSYTCREIADMLTEYLEERLPPAARDDLEAHLAACPDCVAYLRQVRATARALGELAPAPVPPAIEEELVGIFRAWKRRRDGA